MPAVLMPVPATRASGTNAKVPNSAAPLRAVAVIERANAGTANRAGGMSGAVARRSVRTSSTVARAVTGSRTAPHGLPTNASKEPRATRQLPAIAIRTVPAVSKPARARWLGSVRCGRPGRP